jgi:hypothetical protein
MKLVTGITVTIMKLRGREEEEMKKNKTKVKEKKRRRNKKSENEKSYPSVSSNGSTFSVSLGAVNILVVGGLCDRHRSIAKSEYRIIRSAQNKLSIRRGNSH